jgi:hypothetical protein
MHFITLIWLSIMCQQCLNASDVFGEDSAAGVVEGNVMPTKADLMSHESNAEQSEGHKLPVSLNAQLRSRQHVHVQPQKQSSVMPGRKRRSTRSRVIVVPSVIVGDTGRRKRRQTADVESAESNGAQETSNVSEEEIGTGVVEGNVSTKADLISNESNAVLSEGGELATLLNAKLRSRQHSQPQRQSSVMPGRKRRSTRRAVPSVIVADRCVDCHLD